MRESEMVLGTRWVRHFSEVGIEDVPLVGGKNASLGEMTRELGTLGIRVPEGFALTADAYRHFLESNGLVRPVREALEGLEAGDVEDLGRRSRLIRDLVLRAEIPSELKAEVRRGHEELSSRYGVDHADVAVRSSATAEDLPTASFAGQQESYLNVHGEAQLLESIRKCFASLFTPRAISYREDMGFDHFGVALSVGIQKMVRSDLASSGVIFTLDTESGFPDVVFVTSTWGLGENIVQGRVIPDGFYVHKPTLGEGFTPLIRKRLGTKEFKLVYDSSGHRLVENVPTSPQERAIFSVSDEDVLELARWAVAIEEHYGQKRGEKTFMDIEWAKDGLTGDLFILQARPETVHGAGRAPTLRMHRLRERGRMLAEGLAVGNTVATGPARVLEDPSEIEAFRHGEVLITEITDPDWEPIMKVASAIVTERGGRTSHAAIVARELGIAAVVGTGDTTQRIRTGVPVTVSCCEGEVGHVYAGVLDYEVTEVDPGAVSRPSTKIMMNVANPERVFELAQIPNDGVGLARMEFVFAGWVGVHPLALTRYASLPPGIKLEVSRLTRGYEDKSEFFVDRLSQGVSEGVLYRAARPVLVARGGENTWPPREIVVGDDGSAEAGRAGELAAEIGDLFGARTTLVRATDNASRSHGSSGYGANTSERVVVDFQRDNRMDLRLRSEVLGLKVGTQPETRLVEGDAARAILEAAREHPATLVAVGARELGGIRRAFLGGVSNKVLRASEGPVLVCATPAEIPDAGLRYRLDQGAIRSSSDPRRSGRPATSLRSLL